MFFLDMTSGLRAFSQRLLSMKILPSWRYHLAVLGDLHHGAGLAVEGKGDQAGHTRQGDEADEQKPETKGFA